MSALFSRRYLLPLLVFLFLDLLAVGMGMGVPIFAILLGFVTGWLAPRVLAASDLDLRQLLRRCLLAALLTAGFTFPYQSLIKMILQERIEQDFKSRHITRGQ